jgi:hypothetical protein
MKSIWYFVGLLLTVFGCIILLTGLYLLVYPPDQPKILSHLHPDLWWGGVMIVFGLVFLLLNRRTSVQ